MIAAGNYGVVVEGSANVLEGNYIGTDATGTVNYGAGQWDVNVVGANTIGGSTTSPGTGAGNLIVGAPALTVSISREAAAARLREPDRPECGRNRDPQQHRHLRREHVDRPDDWRDDFGTCRNISSGNATDGIQIERRCSVNSPSPMVPRFSGTTSAPI